jgi:hypothetical protein
LGVLSLLPNKVVANIILLTILQSHFVSPNFILQALKMHHLIKLAGVSCWLLLFLSLISCGGSSTPSASDITDPVIPEPANSAPQLDANFIDVQADAGIFFKVELLGRFSDEGDLVISAAESDEDKLPDWLWLDTQQMILSGIPSSLQSGSTNITVTATDEQGLSTSAGFAVSVTPVSSSMTIEQIAEDELYIDNILAKESNFLQMGVGVNATTGLTHDGVGLNSSTLEPLGEPSRFSAASKESLHLNVLAKTILNDQRAQRLLSGNDVINAVSIALNLLEQKITSYEQFDTEYPAFGGFFPWFISEDRGNGVGVYPLSGWEDRLPALDNGQLAWSIFLTYKSLYKMGYNNLAERYEQRFQKMASNAKTLFFDPQRNVISGISQFVDLNGNADSSLPPEQLSYIKDSYALTDSYEGELMAVFMTLFSNDLSATEKQEIWANKFVNSRNYTTTSGEVLTVIEGWAFSSHEQWKFLVLPYLDFKDARDLYLNGEKVRADFSNKHQFRGFFASVNAPDLNYMSLLGVQAVASEIGVGNTVSAPYATFPMLLADQVSHNNTGLNWLRNVLAYDKMLGDYGMTESYDTHTFAIASLLTWDGKVLTDLAMMGGVFRETREFMIEDGIYLPFMALIEGEYAKINAAIEGLDLAIAEPLITPVPMDPCADSVTVEGMISDFDCQKLMSLPGVTVVENPHSSAENPSQYVGQYVDPVGPWDALVIDFNDSIDLSSNNIFTIKVIAPVAGILKVKLEGGDSTEIERDINISQLDSWGEYSFDFADQANEDHRKIAVFFNAGVTNPGNDTYYIDDITLGNGVVAP